MKLSPRSPVPLTALLAVLAIHLAAQAVPTDAPPPDPSPAYGAQLEGFAYPWPVAEYRFRSQNLTLEMAYMDVTPARPN